MKAPFIPTFIASCFSFSIVHGQWSTAATGNTNDAGHDYNNTANWTGGVINDTFNDSPVLGGVTLYFSGDRTTTGTLTLGYGGGGALTLQGNSVNGPGNHTLTLGGNVFLSNAGNQTTVIGSTTAGNALNVNLGGTTRTFSGNAVGRSIRFLNTVSNGSIVIEGGARVELGSTSNSFSSGILVKNGTLASFGEISGTPFGTGTITLGDSTGSASATLDHRGGSASNISNAIHIAAGSTGALSIAPTAGNNNYTGPITLANNLRIAPSSNGAVSFSGGITGTGNLTIQQSGGGTSTTFHTTAVNFTGSINNISSAGGANGVRFQSAIGANVTTVTQNSAVKLQLSAVNSYVGATFITSGTLETSGSGTLGGGDINIFDSNLAILTLGNAQGIADTANLYFGNASTINLNFLGADTIGALYNTTQGTYMTAGIWTASELNTYFGVTSFTGSGSLNVTVIPEPSVPLSALGSVGLMALFRRRRA